MVAHRDKTVSYRRAEWHSPTVGITLQKCIRRTLNALPTIDDRSLVNGPQYSRIAKDEAEPTGGMFIHITTETPGESASVVPKVASTASELIVTTEKPPADGEWLDGDAFLYVNDDHVCICATGVHDGAIGFFLRELFRRAKLPPDYIEFQLLKAADISKLKMLHRQGVKEIEIAATLFEATAHFEKRKAHVVGSLGAIGKFLKGFLGKPHDCTEDSLRVILTIKTDKRRKGLIIGEKHIENMADDIVKNYEGEDSYVIITKTDQKISPNEIFMKSKVSIPANGKTVDRDGAWKELLRFYKSLESGGVFEQ